MKIKLEPWQKRVVKEKTDLDNKIAKLDVFIASNVFLTLRESESMALQMQRDVMKLYSEILGARIAEFTLSHKVT